MGNQQARRMASAALGEFEPGNVVDESVSSPVRKPPLAPLTYGWVWQFLPQWRFYVMVSLSYHLTSKHVFLAPDFQSPDLWYDVPSAIQSMGHFQPSTERTTGWPEGPTFVPVAINWTQGGSIVEVEGSFDNWQSRQALHRSGNREFAIVKMLPPGVYQYKFIIDGEWKYAPDQPAMYDEMGNVNNVLKCKSMFLKF